jgi:hypothetical protein
MATREKLRARLRIPNARLDAINALMLDPDMRVVNDLLDVVAKYGTPEEINAKAAEARKLPNLMNRLSDLKSPYRKDVQWLIARRDAHSFVSMADYRRDVLGDKADQTLFRDDVAVTLEISAAQYFPWLIEEARQAIARRELMPARFIRVRNEGIRGRPGRPGRFRRRHAGDGRVVC